tara:strand:- start:301 stop:498 length:198 start_codon:yes stop_codon:yes gene_type:complete
MTKETKIFRSNVTLATLHNRRDFSKRFSTLEKFAKPFSSNDYDEFGVRKSSSFNQPQKEKGKQNA